MKKIALTLALIFAIANNPAQATEKYTIDTTGAHAFVQFRIKHLGYSWLYGRFNTFSGDFTLDRDKLENSTVTVEIETKSVDTNHAERDKHLRAENILNTDTYPKATFKSTGLKLNEDKNSGILTGDLSLHGTTRPIEIAVKLTGEGDDPWGGYRAGFEGSTSFKLKDFGIQKDLGPASTEVEMILSIEGIRQ